MAGTAWPSRLLLIFVGAGLGGVLRYWIGGVVQSWCGPTFPTGTLAVNVTGWLAKGFLAAAVTGPVLIDEKYRVAILIGVLGGYTTFSSFGRETMTLVTDGQWFLAGLNVTLSNVLSLAGVWAGAAVAARAYGPGAP